MCLLLDGSRQARPSRTRKNKLPAIAWIRKQALTNNLRKCPLLWFD